MPTSQPQQISSLVDLIIFLNPQTVLDIGVGFGKYGVLCREYLELWDGREDYQRFTRRIDGIEAFSQYLTPLHQFIYDHIYVGNAIEVIDTLKTSYDLVLLIDVLEHFTAKDGAALIKKLVKRHGGVLVSTPKDIGDQQDAFHNDFERHRSQWNQRSLSKLAPALFIPEATSHIAYLTQKQPIADIKRNFKLHQTKRFLIRQPLVKKLYAKLTRKA